MNLPSLNSVKKRRNSLVSNPKRQGPPQKPDVVRPTSSYVYNPFGQGSLDGVDGMFLASPAGFPIGFVARESCCGFSFMPWLSRR